MCTGPFFIQLEIISNVSEKLDFEPVEVYPFHEVPRAENGMRKALEVADMLAQYDGP